MTENKGKPLHQPPITINNGTTIMDLTDIVDYDIFRLLVQYVYTNTCDVFRPDFNVTHGLARQNDLPEKISSDSVSDDTYGMEELTINERNRHQSAYSVYKEHQEKQQREGGANKKKRKQKKAKGGQTDSKEHKDGPFRVAKRIRDEAKKLGIETLAKRLENVKCLDGCLVNFGPTSGSLRFNPGRFPHLSDVVLKSEEEALFPCHKCVLVARLDYFQSMLGCGWMEASTKEPLQMAMPATVLEVVLEYLYMDSAPRLDGCQDMELLCNTLTIADQLFITRLKDICELAIADLITLRNVAELLQFASVYQAPQLKATCHQFISLNLACLIEVGSLDALDEDVLEELSTAYKQTLPYKRFITPSLDKLDISHIDPHPPVDKTSSLDRDFSAMSLEPKSSNSTTSDFESLVKKAKTKRKGRRRTSSTGKRASVSISESGDDFISSSYSEEFKLTSASGSGPCSDVASTSVSQSRSSVNLSSSHATRSTTPSCSKELVCDKKATSTSPRSEDERDVTGKSKNTARQKEGDNNRTGRRSSDEETGRPTGPVSPVRCNMKLKSPKQVSLAGDQWSRKGTAKPLEIEIPPHAEKNGPTSPATTTNSTTTSPAAKSWTWTNPTSPVTDLRDIMQSQGNKKGATTPAPSTPTPSTTMAATAKSPLVSPTLSPTQRPSSRGPTPMGKKSQKQRKKELQAAMSAMGDQKKSSEDKGVSQAAGEKSPACPWAKITAPRPSQVSFRDLQAQEERIGSETACLASSPPERKTYSAARKISFGLATSSQRSTEGERLSTSGPASPESPKEMINPWQRTGAVSPPTASVSFSEIVRAEWQQKDSLDKAMNKSLSQIQIEERAIEELFAHYHGAGKSDEYVTVERVHQVMAAPLWKKMSENR